MKRFAFLLGPELLWLLFFLLSCWLASRNTPPTLTGNTFLGRLITAVMIGVNACLFKLIAGIDYGDSRNSGVLGIWVYGILAGGVAFVPGIITTLVLLSRGMAPPK